jgi:hypothetical protein
MSRKRRVKRDKPSAQGYNWATLFLGDINRELGLTGWERFR